MIAIPMQPVRTPVLDSIALAKQDLLEMDKVVQMLMNVLEVTSVAQMPSAATTLGATAVPVILDILVSNNCSFCLNCNK